MIVVIYVVYDCGCVVLGDIFVIGFDDFFEVVYVIFSLMIVV